MIDLDGKLVEPGLAIVKGAPVPAEVLARKAKPIVWIVENRIAEGCQVIVASSPKVGKSLLALWLASRIASGEPFMGHACYQRPVIYTGIEDGEDRIARRLDAMGAQVPSWREGMFQANWGLEGYQHTLAALRDGFNGLWIVDPMIEVLAQLPDFDENDATCVTAFLKDHREAVQRSKATIAWIDHFRKLGDMKRGSTAKDAVVDGWVDVAPTKRAFTLRLSWTLRDGPGGVDACEISKPNGLFQFVTVDAGSLDQDDGEGSSGPRRQTNGEVVEDVAGRIPSPFTITEVDTEVARSGRSISTVTIKKELDRMYKARRLNLIEGGAKYERVYNP